MIDAITSFFAMIFEPIGHFLVMVFEPIGHIFTVIYNFIQTNPFFAKNLFNFLIVAGAFIFAYFAFNVTGFFEKKSQEISDSIKKSEDKKEQSIIHFEQTKDSLKNVDNDVKKIVKDAEDLAKTIDEKSEARLKDELVNLENRENILKEGYTQKAEKEVFKKISNAALRLSQEYIENSLDENTHRELIYNFINDLENMRVE